MSWLVTTGTVVKLNGLKNIRNRKSKLKISKWPCLRSLALRNMRFYDDVNVLEN